MICRAGVGLWMIPAYEDKWHIWGHHGSFYDKLRNLMMMFYSLVSSSSVRRSQPTGVLLLEAAGSTCPPVWFIHFNPTPKQGQSLSWPLQRYHHSWWFPQRQHHPGMQISWPPPAMHRVRMDVPEQSAAGVWRLPPDNSHHAGGSRHFCHCDQEKTDLWEGAGHSQDEEEEEKRSRHCLLMSTH